MFNLINNAGSSLSFESFIKKLKQVQEYQADGGTIYRQKTAGLSLEVALVVKKVHPFLDPVESKNKSSHLFVLKNGNKCLYFISI